MNLPVTIAGVGGGFNYESDGPTHHANQDIGAMRAIPKIRILNASDKVSISTFPHLAYKFPMLTYIRFDKGNYPILYSSKHNFLDGVSEMVKGTDLVIITTGVMTQLAIKIAGQFKDKVGVIDIYQLKPINEKKLLKLISKYEKIVVLEEHLSYGGLATIIADFIVDYGIFKKFLRIGLPDQNFFVYGDRNYMHEKIGISYSQIISKIEKFEKRK
jgi:transketolase